MTSSASAGWRDRYAGILFSALFALAAVLGYVGPLGLAPLAAIGGLLALPLLRPGKFLWIGGALVLSLMAWAAVSMVWSRATPDLVITDYDSLERLTGVKLLLQGVLFTALAAGAARLGRAQAEQALRIGSFAMTGLAAVLILEGVGKAHGYMAMEAMIGQPIRPDLALRNVAQGGYVLALAVWPASLLLRREGRNPLVFALVAGVLGSTVMFGADAPAAALATGLIALLAVLAAGRAAVFVLGVLSVFYVAAAPWVVGIAAHAGWLNRFKAVLPPSWDARMDIWSFAAERVGERPLQGWGLDASRTWPGSLPLHTHNGALQIWLELGLPGVVLASGVVAFMFWIIGQAREGRGYMGVACATLVAYLTIGGLSFGVWQEWWLGLGAIAFCACLALKRALPALTDDLELVEDFGKQPLQSA